MAVLDHHDHPVASQNQCAVQFALTWVGFFVVIGLVSWIVSSL